MKKSKMAVFSMAAAVAALVVSVNASAFEDIPKVYVDYEEINFDKAPQLKDGEVYVPIRGVLEKYLNRKIEYEDTDSGKLLRIFTSDGYLTINLNNGVYAYVIENYNYDTGNIFANPFDDEFKDKMGILKHKPYISDGSVMLPIREIVELLDGKVNYDEELGQISVVSRLYTDYFAYVGQPFPVVYNMTDLDIFDSEKISDCKGYEDYIEKCRKYNDLVDDGLGTVLIGDLSFYDDDELSDEREFKKEYDNIENSYKELMNDTMGYLYEMKDNPLIDGIMGDFVRRDCSGSYEPDDSLDMNKSIENAVNYYIEKILNKDYDKKAAINKDYEELFRFLDVTADFMRDMNNADLNKLGKDGVDEIIWEYADITSIVGYLTSVYDEETMEYLDTCLEEAYDKHKDEFSASQGSIKYNFNLASIDKK